MSAIRKEIQEYIDSIPDSKLEALKPLLSVLANESIIIETNLTEEERAIIVQGRAAYAANPEGFVPLGDI